MGPAKLHRGKRTMKLKANIKYFNKRVYFYQKYFGLEDWEISIFSQKDNRTRARCNFNMEGRIASIHYSKSWIKDKRVKKEEVNRVAFHEVAELFLSDTRIGLLASMAEPLADEKIHKIIRFLENKILGQQ